MALALLAVLTPTPQRPPTVAWPYQKVIVSVHIFLRVFTYLPTAFAVWRIRHAHDVIRVKIAQYFRPYANPSDIGNNAAG